MANFPIANDTVWTFTIHVVNQAGELEPAPAGDVFSVSSSNPASLAATIGVDASGAPAVVVTPLVAAGTGYTVTTTDAAGLTNAVDVFDIVPDTTPKAIVLDLVDGVSVAQAVPTAPGP